MFRRIGLLAVACFAVVTTGSAFAGETLMEPTTVEMAVDEPAPPAKAACARCHDGRSAFKLTGHACSRCHGTVVVRTATDSK